MPHGEAAGPVWRQRNKGNFGKMPLLWFPQEGDGESGSAHLGLASLNHIILVGSKGKGGGVPDCGTWAWGISVGEQWLQYESLINEVVGVWTLHWLVCI